MYLKNFEDMKRLNVLGRNRLKTKHQIPTINIVVGITGTLALDLNAMPPLLCTEEL